MKAKTTPFFLPGSASDSYEAVRDCAHLGHVRERIELLWPIYAPYADRFFLDNAKCQFHQRTWELYVGCVLIQHGFELKKVSDEGPEFYVEIGGEKIWVEAIAPEPGQGPDAVPPPPSGGVISQQVPDQEIVLRLTNALETKWQKYNKDVGKGLVAHEDCYVIALNEHNASGGRGASTAAYLFKAVLGFVDQVVLVDPEQNAPPEWYYQQREQIVKKSGAPVSTTTFLSPARLGISAILYSTKDILQASTIIGSEISYLHNPFAKNPLPSGAFRFGTEYWYTRDTGKIEHRDWNNVQER